MRIRQNKEPGITVIYTEEEARILKYMVHGTNYHDKITQKEKEFRQTLWHLLTREGVELT